MSLSQKIAFLRRKKGLTQEELAGLVNVTARTIQRIESGDSTPRAFTLKAIATALDVSFEELYAGIDQKPAGREMVYDREEMRHYLRLLCLSCFSYVVIPYVHFLIPLYLSKKRKDQPPAVLNFSRRVIRVQIGWGIAIHLSLLLTLAYNLISLKYFNNRTPLHYLVVFFFMYFLNALIIGAGILRIKKIVPLDKSQTTGFQ